MLWMKRLFNMRQWLERRFWDFRYGHGTYLAYALSLINFIVINYSLLVSNIPFLSRIFNNLWVFAVVFTCTYFPLATMVGWKLYRKAQYKTDVEVSVRENPFRFRTLVPSRETILDLPMQRLDIIVLRRIARKMGLLSPEEEQLYDHYLALINKLMAGESVEHDQVQHCNSC